MRLAGNLLYRECLPTLVSNIVSFNTLYIRFTHQVLPEDNWFCHSDCMTIYASLQSIIFNEAKIVPETLSKQLGKLQPNGLMTNAGFDVRWQLLSGKIRSSENRFLLSKAFEIFRVSHVEFPIIFVGSFPRNSEGTLP